MQKNNQNSGGFTLIEVLVVVLIIGILTSVAIPQYTRAVQKAKLAEALQTLKVLSEAEHVYYDTYGRYTSDIRELDVAVSSDGGDKWSEFGVIEQNGEMLVQVRIPFLPFAVYLVIAAGDKFFCSQNFEAKTLQICQKFYGNKPADPSSSDWERISIL